MDRDALRRAAEAAQDANVMSDEFCAFSDAASPEAVLDLLDCLTAAEKETAEMEAVNMEQAEAADGWRERAERAESEAAAYREALLFVRAALASGTDLRAALNVVDDLLAGSQEAPAEPEVWEVTKRLEARLNERIGEAPVPAEGDTTTYPADPRWSPPEPGRHGWQGEQFGKREAPAEPRCPICGKPFSYCWGEADAVPAEEPKP